MREGMPQQWEPVEKNVQEAEVVERKRRKAATSVSRGKEKEDGSRYDLYPKSRARRKTEEHVAHHAEQVDTLLGEENSPERQLVSFEKKNLMVAVRAETKIQKKRDALLQEETEILSSLGDTPSEADQEALEEIRSELRDLENERKELLESNPEAFFGIHLKELKEYKQQMESGRIVETPYVKKQIEDILAHLRAGKPVFTYGHLGTGKTELAMHVARKYLGKEAVVVSGSKNMALAELYGHQVLAIDKIDRGEIDRFAQEVEGKFEAWKEAHSEASEQDQSLAHDRILQTYLSTLKGGTISEFFVGPIYKAMAEGRPVIIDEVNAIPHEILISLNHILTRRAGDVVGVQQDSGMTVTVQDGFGVMMTGNINQGQKKYVERQDMDPAFLSRLYKKEHDYLPQKTEGALLDANNEVTDDAGEENELFLLILSKVMDKNGNITAPKDSIRKLWNLAKAARLTQDVFSGKQVNSAFYFQAGGGRALPHFLQESVLSLRALDGILSQWQKDGFKHELDYYLNKEFVSQSTVASDKAYLYQIFKDQFGFFQTDGWEQNPNYGSGGAVHSFSVATPENPSEEVKFFGPREVVQFAYGKAPERTEWPEFKESTQVEEAEEQREDEAMAEAIRVLEEARDNIRRELQDLAKEVNDHCDRETASAPAGGSTVAKKSGGLLARIFKK